MAVMKLCAIVMLLTTNGAFAECKAPVPPEVPDGQTATKDEMMAALKEFRHDFQPDIQEFQHCIREEKSAVGDVATKDQIAKWDNKFDAAFVMEKQQADKMNFAIRAYKARLPKKK